MEASTGFSLITVTDYFLPLTERDSFLVMDNVSIHTERELRIILASKNITLVKLPPYSYDFNPIELVFGITKGYVTRWPELLRANVPFAIVNAFSQVSVNSVRNCYRKFWQVLTKLNDAVKLWVAIVTLPAPCFSA